MSKAKANPKKTVKDKRVIRKRECRFCQDKITFIDYKDWEMVKRFVTERGKVRARRTTGCCAKHQRQLARAVKRVRLIGQIPFKIEYFRR